MLRADRALERFLDRAAHDELVAHDAHRLTERGAQHRLAEAAGDARQRSRAGSCKSASLGRTIRPVSIRPQVEALTNSDSASPRCAAQSPRGDLVGDQLVRSRIVRDAQQRFGQAHQDHAFLRRQIVLAQERVEPGALDLRRAHAFDEMPCAGPSTVSRCAGDSRAASASARTICSSSPR